MGTVTPLDPYQHAGLIEVIDAFGRARGYSPDFVTAQRNRLLELLKKLHKVTRLPAAIGEAITRADLPPDVRSKVTKALAGDTAAVLLGLQAIFMQALEDAFPPYDASTEDSA